MIDPNKQLFYFNKNNDTSYYPLSGINNLSLSTSQSYQDPFVLGGNPSALQVNSPNQVELVIQYDLIQREQLLGFTGDSDYLNVAIFNGSIYYTVNKFYLNQYDVQFSIGEIPKINAKFTSYGNDINNQTSITTASNPYQIDLPNLCSLFLSGTSSGVMLNNNNIYSSQYTITTNRNVFYSVGSNSAIVCLNKPINIGMTINSKFDEAAYIDNSIKPNTYPTNLNLYLVNSGTYSTTCYPMFNGRISSMEARLNSENFLELKREMVGYYGI
jgi:hypothetical protein